MPTTLGEQFARALAAQDAGRLRDLLADDFEFQALTPGRHWSATTATEAVDGIILGPWFGPDADIHELRSVTTGRVSDCEHVGYRVGVRRGGHEYVVEQQAYYSPRGERIGSMRIACSGYRPDRTR